MNIVLFTVDGEFFFSSSSRSFIFFCLLSLSIFAKAAILKGAIVSAFDPIVSNWDEVNTVDFISKIPNSKIFDAIIFAVPHKEFARIDLSNWISNKETLIFDANNVNDFLEPTLEKYLPNPTIFNDLKKASVRVFNAIKNKENISILGDYDVDGLSSIAILKKYFNFFGVNTFSYIPDRINEGYGPNLKAIDIIKSKKTSLLIMVDCGTNSHDIISYIKKKKLI